MTLDEFFEKTEARRLLVENLETNIEQFDLDTQDAENLMRLNLLVIRNCMQDEGVE